MIEGESHTSCKPKLYVYGEMTFYPKIPNLDQVYAQKAFGNSFPMKIKWKKSLFFSTLHHITMCGDNINERKTKKRVWIAHSYIQQQYVTWSRTQRLKSLTQPVFSTSNQLQSH